MFNEEFGEVLMTDEWICWNYETGFSVIDARDEDDAKLQCELNQPAVLLGEEEEIKENIRVLLEEEVIIETKLLDRQIGNAEHYKKHWKFPKDMDAAQSYGYWDGRLDLLNEIKRQKHGWKV